MPVPLRWRSITQGIYQELPSRRIAWCACCESGNEASGYVSRYRVAGTAPSMVSSPIVASSRRSLLAVRLETRNSSRYSPLLMLAPLCRR
jgi:hypothetical protein